MRQNVPGGSSKGSNLKAKVGILPLLHGSEASWHTFLPCALTQGEGWARRASKASCPSLAFSLPRPQKAERGWGARAGYAEDVHPEQAV